MKLSTAAFEKIKQQKIDDGFEDRGWGEWLTWKSRDVKVGNTVGRRTTKHLLSSWCQNFAHNLPQILEGESITSLVPSFAEEIDHFQHNPIGAAIVVGAGPSIYLKKHLEVLADAINSGKYKGIVCVSDKMLKPCIEHGIIPYISVSVDGSPLIAEWYRDLPEIAIGKVHACLNVSVHPTVTEACNKSRIKINWFNPLQDGEDNIETFTRLQKMMTTTADKPNGVPAIACGGNAGAATWVLTQTLLRRSPIALIGMDLGYPEGTNLEKTPYFSAFIQGAHGDVGVLNYAYKKFYHPVFKTTAYYDDVFRSYKETFLSLAEKAALWGETVNCTEGGTIYGPRIKCMQLIDWLKTL